MTSRYLDIWLIEKSASYRESRVKNYLYNVIEIAIGSHPSREVRPATTKTIDSRREEPTRAIKFPNKKQRSE
jgi:hypothetical protein